MAQTPDVTTDAETRADRELLDQLYQNSPISLFASTAVALLLLSALYNSAVGMEVIVTWVIALMMVNLARLILRSVRESSMVSDRYANIWLACYLAITLAAGLLWASLILIYRQSTVLHDQIIVLATLLGIPFAAMTNNALKLPVYFAFSLPILLALLYWSLFVSTGSHAELSILALAYGVIVVLTGTIYHNRYKQALRIKYEKQDLVDELSLANRRLEEFAYIDPLTGLTNRRRFGEQADQALERCQRRNKRLALLLIDLDNFKEINDTLGHASGDEILIIVSKRLKAALRQTDTVALSTEDTARYGGDEFILLLEDFTEIEDVSSTAERILQEVNEPIGIERRSFLPACSIGVSIFPDDAQSVTNLIRQADIALYQAKQSGKGCARFFRPLQLN